MKKLQSVALFALVCLCDGYQAVAVERSPQSIEEPVSAPAINAEQASDTMPQPARLLMGNISAALLEADHKMTDAALSHLGSARQDIIDLEKEDSGFKSADRVRVGRLNYTIRPSRKVKYRQQRYALFPFEDGTFAIQIPEISKNIGQQARIDLNDAKAGLVHVDWDIAATKGDLEEAIKALSENDPIKAARLLQVILNGDITIKDEVASDPLQSVYDQVMLANSLFIAKDYTFTRLALYHAQSELKQYAFCTEVMSDEQVRTLGNEIHIVAEELKKEDPTAVEKIKGKIRHWIDTLRLWINPHARTGAFIQED